MRTEGHHVILTSPGSCAVEEREAVSCKTQEKRLGRLGPNLPSCVIGQPHFQQLLHQQRCCSAEAKLNLSGSYLS